MRERQWGGLARAPQWIAGLCLLGLALSPPVRADQVVVGEANYTAARVVTFADGLLYFRTADGRARSARVEDVGLIIVDRGAAFADFNQAERYLAAAEPAQAITRYRRNLRLTEAFWADLIAARLIAACDRAGRLDEATLNYIRVVRGEWSGPAAAVRNMPESIPEKRNARVVRAIEQLDAAVAAGPPMPQRVAMQLLRYRILDRSGDKQAPVVARDVASLSLPESLRCEQTYAILLNAMEAALEEDLALAGLESLDNAIRDCPATLLPGFLLLRGSALLRAASTPDDLIRASWPFMRIAIHMPDDPGAPDGLYGAALALERIGQPDKAAELLTECLAHERVSGATRRDATAALERLQSAVAAPG